ncbi:hypothetical protein F4778DRAFT_755484 [Xylariomycetidae sp. FL2044]|nr:hypothetical protein F4778DRAFT_755484 [Xylariomycetidae sp. FL2044]
MTSLSGEGVHYDEEGNSLHAIHLEQTLQELQAQVGQHEATLAELRTALGRSRQSQSISATASLDIMKAAYDELTKQSPFLPFPESVLPALIALRRTHQTMQETRAYLDSRNEAVEKAKQRLAAEKAHLKDQEALSASLQNRIQSLKEGLDNRMEMGPEDIARERMEELRQKKKNYHKETSQLLKALRKFIDDHLAAMLAAEELGGPVVGDMMDIDGDDLAAGFNAQGRPKKAKAALNEDKRQRRIDEIWGHQDDDQSETMTANNGDRNETAAAGAEMRDLTEELLNTLAQAEGDRSAAYVQLPRETAAARFLVRSKVAQFHPKDSSKLRLIDFGRELDD